MKRSKRPRRVGKKVLREMEARLAFTEAVIARAKTARGWVCERCGDVFDNPRCLHAHHRLPKSQGGKHDAKNNSACLCFCCHRLVHDHADDGLSPWWKWIVCRNTLGKSA